jgi:dienelactone hydrolase
MSDHLIQSPAADGLCPTYVVTPDADGPHATGPWPAIIFYMDGVGIRPTLVDMAQRLANSGYLVLVPDMFYRYGPYPPFVPAEVFKIGFREAVGPLMATTGNARSAQDDALTAAGVKFTAEIYPGAHHGWMKTDFPVYDHAAAERGWSEMLALFARNLH